MINKDWLCINCAKLKAVATDGCIKCPKFPAYKQARECGMNIFLHCQCSEYQPKQAGDN